MKDEPSRLNSSHVGLTSQADCRDVTYLLFVAIATSNESGVRTIPTKSAITPVRRICRDVTTVVPGIITLAYRLGAVFTRFRDADADRGRSADERDVPGGPRVRATGALLGLVGERRHSGSRRKIEELKSARLTPKITVF